MWVYIEVSVNIGSRKETSRELGEGNQSGAEESQS